MKKILEVENLTVSYHTCAGLVQSVRGVSFGVREGEALAIVGESGCGKSVTAKSIMGLIQSPPGEIGKGSRILFDGENILEYDRKKWQAYRGADCAIIFQDALAALNPTLSVGRQIEEKLYIHKRLSKDKRRAEAINLLKQVGIPNPEKRLKQYPHEFSGGMRQRVMIAIALACNPRVLIADEPTTALDVTIQADIIELIRDLKDKLNMTVIMITHDLGIVANIAERIVVMYAGKVVEEGNSHDIFYRPKHPYTAALLKSVPQIDKKEGQVLDYIEGSPPGMISLPAGCGFCARCERRMKICREKEPPKFEFEDGHFADCWLYHPYAGGNDHEE